MSLPPRWTLVPGLLAMLATACGASPPAASTMPPAASTMPPAAPPMAPATSLPAPAAPAAAPAGPAEAGPSPWTWLDPGDDARYAFEGERLTITAPDGNDLWPDYNFGAPRLTRAVEGDFALELRVRVDGVAVYNGAGIVAGVGPDTLVRLERGNPQGKHGVGLTAYEGGRFTKNGGGFNTEATDVALKLVREGDAFTGWARAADAPAWRRVGTVTLALPARLQAGPALVNQRSGRPFSATFWDLRYLAP